MSRRTVLEIRIRPERSWQGGDQYIASMVLDDEAVDSIIRRAGRGAAGPGWPAVVQYTMLAVQQALLDWASKAFPREVQSDADVLAIGLMNLKNLHRREDG